MISHDGVRKLIDLSDLPIGITAAPSTIVDLYHQVVLRFLPTYHRQVLLIKSIHEDLQLR